FITKARPSAGATKPAASKVVRMDDFPRHEALARHPCDKVRSLNMGNITMSDEGGVHAVEIG
ncbi:MAG TPA: hypothetical protein VHT48_03605, partial [Methylocella sp.]|nr:hypothetical protein [Methylocella sp.]